MRRRGTSAGRPRHASRSPARELLPLLPITPGLGHLLLHAVDLKRVHHMSVRGGLHKQMPRNSLMCCKGCAVVNRLWNMSNREQMYEGLCRDSVDDTWVWGLGAFLTLESKNSYRGRPAAARVMGHPATHPARMGGHPKHARPRRMCGCESPIT